MRILLIGGTGFIGTWLTRELGGDHEVTVADPVPFSTRQANWLAGEGAAWEYHRSYHHVGLRGFDVVIPLVGLLGSVASMEEPLDSLCQGAEFNLCLLEELVRAETKPLVIFPSSDLAHRPRCLYSIHKVLVEKYLELYHRVYGIPYVILRMATGYGPWQRRDSVINFFIRQGLREKSLPVYGKPYDGLRAFIYIEDAARAFRLAVEGILKPNDWYNLTGHNNALTGVANAVMDLVGGKTVHIEWPPMARKVDVGHLPVPSHVLRDVGWRPEVGLGEGILRTAAWMRGDE